MTEDVLEIIHQLDEPVFTAVEIAEHGGVSRPTAHKRLEELQEEGVVARKNVGSRAVVWWLVGEV